MGGTLSHDDDKTHDLSHLSHMSHNANTASFYSIANNEGGSHWNAGNHSNCPMSPKSMRSIDGK